MSSRGERRAVEASGRRPSPDRRRSKAGAGCASRLPAPRSWRRSSASAHGPAAASCFRQTTRSAAHARGPRSQSRPSGSRSSSFGLRLAHGGAAADLAASASSAASSRATVSRAAASSSRQRRSSAAPRSYPATLSRSVAVPDAIAAVRLELVEGFLEGERFRARGRLGAVETCSADLHGLGARKGTAPDQSAYFT